MVLFLGGRLMPNNIKEIQEFVRKKIIVAAHFRSTSYITITLPRVLNALDKSENGTDLILNTSGRFYENGLVKNCDSVDAWWCAEEYFPEWQLLNKDGSEAIFQDQTEETQIAIAKLLGWEDQPDAQVKTQVVEVLGSDKGGCER